MSALITTASGGGEVRSRSVSRRLACRTALAVLAVAAATVGTAAAAAPPNTAGSKAAAVRTLQGLTPAQPSSRVGTQQVERSREGDAERVVIVRVDRSARIAAVASAARDQHIPIGKKMAAIGALSFRVPADRVASVVADLRKQAGVTSVEVSVARHFTSVPNDPNYAAREFGYLNAVAAPAAWNVQHGSAGVKIAVVDSGVDTGHPDLAGKVVGQYNAVDGTTDVTDTLGHGTFVAGVAAAATNNGVGIAGAGYDTSLLAVKVADSADNIWVDDEITGIIWAADHGANVINLSLGGEISSAAEQSAISYAQNRGVVIVAAAGNSGNIGDPIEYPAAYPGVIAVGATDGQGHRASFSEFGSWVTVAAPGVGIYSTAPTAGSTDFGPSYSSGDGTSFATPLVAGEVALLTAQAPTATTAQLRASVVNSAHGYGGLGLGTGQVDFAGALGHLPPTSAPIITSPATGQPVTGIVHLSALSTASTVRFRVDGAPLGSPVAVTAGSASATWTSYGIPNGTHTVTAVGCSPYGECGTDTASTSFSLTNTAPVVTSPSRGQLIGGAFTLTAAASGGGVAFLIDGVRRAFDATAPYAVAYTASTLRDGSHTVQAIACSTSGTVCQGPSSATVTFTSRSLHPSITSVSPSPFSPNGDARRDTTTTAIHLLDSEVVTVRVLNARWNTVRIAALHTLAAGTHLWVWNGKNGSGTRQPDGTYTVTIDTTRLVAGTTLRGTARRTVRLDTQAPALSSITGAGGGFYPYPDGYRDTFTASATVHEASTVHLYIRNSAGHVVRILSRASAPARVSLTWNGRDSATHLVAAGTYRWDFTATDAAANVRTTAQYRVIVSSKRLTARSSTITRNANSFYSVTGDPSCGQYSTGLSEFPHGVWLANSCDPAWDSYQVVMANYDFVVPGAVKYGNISAATYGFTIFPPSEIFAGYSNTAGGLDARFAKAGAAHARFNLGSVSGATHISGSRHAYVSVGVDDWFNAGGNNSDFDLNYVQLTVSYYVLQ